MARLAKRKDVKNVMDIERDIWLDSLDNPLTEKRVAEMYIKIDEAREKLERKIKEQEEELNNGAGDILKYKKNIKKYQYANNASVALLYTEINFGINHDIVEKECKKFKKEVA